MKGAVIWFPVFDVCSTENRHLDHALRSKRREAFLSILGSCYTTLDAKLIVIKFQSKFYDFVEYLISLNNIFLISINNIFQVAPKLPDISRPAFAAMGMDILCTSFYQRYFQFILH